MSYSQNKDIITQISEYVSQQNRQYFFNQIESKLSKNHVKEIKISDTPFIDKYGRATFFYIELDDVQVPFYQPGTITFSSAVKPGENDFVVCHNGCQQNGPILGMGCSIFIAKFMATLAVYYNRNSQKEDPSFDYELYKLSLLATLNDLSIEDATQHGRILEIKDWLLNFSEQKVQLEPYEESYFYLKELQKLKIITAFTESEINNAKFAVSLETLKQLQSLKQQSRLYGSFDKFFRDHSTQSLYASEQFQDLKKNLLAKKGIFENFEQENKEMGEFLQTVKVGKKFLQSLNKREIAQPNKQINYNLTYKQQQYSSQQLSQNSFSKIPDCDNTSNKHQICSVEQYFSNENFYIPEDFFKNKQIPKYLQKGYQEECQCYIKRIYNFLTILSRSELVYILSQIDPTRKDMKQLLKLTSIVLEQTVANQNNK